MFEEDDELLALRSAALASLNKPRKPHKETEDLDALRQAALKSRKLSEDDEDNIFDKLQPPKSSNLINLTPDPNTVLPSSPKPKDKFNRCSSESSDNSDIESVSSQNSRGSSGFSLTSESESSSDSSQEEESSKESDDDVPEKRQQKVSPAVVKPSKADDDDILNAIDQFLEGDFEIVEKKSPQPKEKTKEPRLKPKVKKKLKKKEKVKEKRQSKGNGDNSRENDFPLDRSKTTEEKSKLLETEVSLPARMEKSPSIEINNQTQKLKKGGDPVRKRKREKGIKDNDSVHSSDLSFLSDSSDDDQDVSGSHKTSQPTVKIMLDAADQKSKSDYKEKHDDSRSKIISLKTSSRQKSKLETKTRDLRAKLKERGLPRSHREGGKNDSLLPSVVEKRDGSTTKSSKIYVKPSLVNKANLGEGKENSRRQSDDNIVITRKITNEQLTEKSIKLKPAEAQGTAIKPAMKENVEEKRKKNNKRSVIQFAPYTPTNEKREKIASLMKNAPKLKKTVQRKKSKDESDGEKSFSDMSEQDFDAFEIADDFDTEVSEATKDSEPLRRRKSSSQPNAPPVDTRVFITAVSNTSDATSSSSGELSESLPSPSPKPASSSSDEEEENKRPRPQSKRPIRDRLGVHVKSFTREKDTMVLERRDARTKLGRRRSKGEVKRRNNTRSSAKEQPREPIVSEEDADDFFRSVDKPKFPSSVVSTVVVKNPAQHNHERPATKDETVHRKRRRKVDIATSEKKPRATAEKTNTRTIKDRLGDSVSSKKVSQILSDRKRKRTSPTKHIGADREKELDARMKRIREQNEAIMKRRQEIEMEEKRFRLT